MSSGKMAEIYDSWEWKLREKLTDANDVIRRIYSECKNGAITDDEYEQFVGDRVRQMMRDIGDVGNKTRERRRRARE